MALLVALVLATAGCTDSGDKDQAAPQTTETKEVDAQKAHLDRFGAYADERELVTVSLTP